MIDITNSLDTDSDNYHSIKTAIAFINFTRCVDHVCVDLKDEFNIEDDDRIRVDQIFIYSLMEDTLLPLYFRSRIAIDDTIGNITVKDDDRKLQRSHTCTLLTTCFLYRSYFKT